MEKEDLSPKIYHVEKSGTCACMVFGKGGRVSSLKIWIVKSGFILIKTNSDNFIINLHKMTDRVVIRRIIIKRQTEFT